MRRNHILILAALPTLLAQPLPAAAQAPEVPSTVLIVHSFGTAIWNDTLPTHLDSISCRNFRADYPPTRLLPPEGRQLRYRCDKVAAGRRLRDSAEVAISPGDLLSHVFVTAARVPHRVEAGPHTCPWGEAPTLRTAALDLKLQYRSMTADSGIVNVIRSCRASHSQGEHFSNEAYYIRRTSSGWVIVNRALEVT